MKTNPPVAVSGEDEELREQLVKLYNESRRLAMLRQGSPIDHMVDGALKLIKSYKKRLKTSAAPKLTPEEKLKHRRMNALPWGVVHCNRCDKEVGGPSQFTVFLGENPKDDYSAHTPCLTDEERAKAQKEGLQK